MKRVVISGMGLVSPLGNNKEETLISLRETKSGIKFQEEYKEMGFRSHVAGSIEDFDIELVFNMDETGLFFRVLPNWTYVKEELSGTDMPHFTM